MKILDCFPYWREYSHITSRRDIWGMHPEYEVVMIAMVGTHTHSGIPITHSDPIRSGIEPGIKTFYADLSDQKLGAWDREKLQRDLLRDKILEFGTTGDLVISSDADEILNPLCINDIYKASYEHKYVIPEMVLLYFDIHTASPTPWLQAKAFMWENCPDSLSSIRTNMSVYTQPSCGWHLSWQGGQGYRREKAKAFAHTEFSSDEAIESIEKSVESGKDVLGLDLIPYNYLTLPTPIIDRFYNAS